MTGIPLIIAFVVAIAAMILLISKLKVHPFLAIMGISLLLAIVAGIPLTDIPGIIGAGFSGTFTSIGIVIILGAFIGTILEKTGAALKLADMVIKVVGEKRPDLAVELMGWVVSIPVFCDSGFVILNPIRKALAKRTGVSSVAMTVCLSAGLYISHVFIPPTPGPIAAANTLGVGDNLLLVIGIGALCSIFPLIAGFFYAKFIGKKIKSADETTDNGEVVKTYEELKAEYGKLPNGFNAIAPLIVPILLMAISSIVSMVGVGENPSEFVINLSKFFTFLGKEGQGILQPHQRNAQDRRSDPVRDRGGRRARQGHRIVRYGELHHPACKRLPGDRHLLPLHPCRDPQERAGFLHGCDHDLCGYYCTASRRARYCYAD